MSFANLQLLNAPTIAVSGGTAQSFAPDGTIVTRGIQVADTSVDSVTSRPVVVAKNQPGTLQSNGSWSRDRRSVKYVLPEVLADKTVDFAFIEITVVKSPLRGASTINVLKEKGVQLIYDTDLTNFWQFGALG